VIVFTVPSVSERLAFTDGPITRLLSRPRDCGTYCKKKALSIFDQSTFGLRAQQGMRESSREVLLQNPGRVSGYRKDDFDNRDLPDGVQSRHVEAGGGVLRASEGRLRRACDVRARVEGAGAGPEIAGSGLQPVRAGGTLGMLKTPGVEVAEPFCTVIEPSGLVTSARDWLPPKGLPERYRAGRRPIVINPADGDGAAGVTVQDCWRCLRRWW